MSNHINQLPEELINMIYKNVFDSCLDEINSIITCCMCESILNVTYSKCKNCYRPVCCHCWNTYCTNYGRGWKPYIHHCKSCVNTKIKNSGYTRIVYLN